MYLQTILKKTKMMRTEPKIGTGSKDHAPNDEELFH